MKKELEKGFQKILEKLIQQKKEFVILKVNQQQI
jgi:hypothetical protein